MQLGTLDVLEACATCGLLTDDVQTHHILPRCLGGTDYPSNLVRICADCHGLIHSAEMVRGNSITPDAIARIRQLRSQGMEYKAISAATGLSVGLCHGVCRD